MLDKIKKLWDSIYAGLIKLLLENYNGSTQVIYKANRALVGAEIEDTIKAALMNNLKKPGIILNQIEDFVDEFEDTLVLDKYQDHIGEYSDGVEFRRRDINESVWEVFFPDNKSKKVNVKVKEGLLIIKEIE